MTAVGAHATLDALSLWIPPSCVVYTPKPLADAMAKSLGDEAGTSWLEPCVGGGVFLRSLSEMGVDPSRIRAIDADVTPGPYDTLGQTLRGVEFLTWSSSTDERFSKIVANPPYVALHRFSPEARRIATKVRVPGGGCVSLGANSWYAFLCASILLLKEGGSLCFVLPAAWDYADYARTLRERITQLFQEVEIYRSCSPLFPSVSEGSIVLVARGFKALNSITLVCDKVVAMKRFESESPSALLAQLEKRAVKRADLPTCVIQPPISVAPDTLRRIHEKESWSTVRDVMDIRLGAVTGDSKYFVVSEETRKKYRLPLKSCRPVIGRAHHLLSGKIDAKAWSILRDTGERVWLFCPSSTQANTDKVRAYLELSPQDGGCDRNAYKIRCRDPWYQTPLSGRVHGFMSGMSGWGPWVVFKEMPQLVATNTLYQIYFKVGDDKDEMAAWAMWLLTSEAEGSIREVGRHYAGGLVKFEPGDVSSLKMRTPSRMKGSYGAYLTAVELLLKGMRKESQRVANRWFSSH